jgi:hypothetical protein
MSGNSSTTYDESQWPVLIVTKSPGEQSDQEFIAHLDTLRSYFQRGARFGLVMDVRHSPILSADRRRMTAERMEEDIRKFGPLLVGVALVLSSPIARGMLTALRWLRPSPDPPMMPFATVAPAATWLRERLVAKRTG